MDAAAIFDNIPKVDTGKPSGNTNGDFRRINEEDQVPQSVDIKTLKTGSKVFVVGGGELTDDVKTILIQVVPSLNMKGYTLRTKTMNRDQFVDFFDMSIVSKEIYLPWPAFNKSVESLTGRAGETEYNVACWLETNLYKNYTVEDFNKISSKRKPFLATEVHLYLGKDLKTKPEFFIIDSPCGSTRFTKETNFQEMSYGAKRLLAVAKLFNIKVYNVRNEDSMNELELVLQS